MAKKIIPRTIHYCWFGNKEKPPIIIDCINSWKKHMPTWEIIEWNEHNFDLSQNSFAQEAFDKKRYAFVTDYCRLKLLYDHGGLYMDSDMLVVKPLDRFLESHAFTGHETSSLTVTAIMGSVKGHNWIKLLLDYYTNRAYNEQTNTNIITQLSRPLIVRENEYGFRFLEDDVVIYPIHTFCSYNHQKLEIIPHEDAYAYHLFAGSWTSRAHK